MKRDAFTACLMCLSGLLPLRSSSQPPDTLPIVVGSEISIESFRDEHPWRVAILDANTENTFSAVTCAGTIVSDTLIVTAAHCTYRNGNELAASGINVLIGTNDLGDPEILDETDDSLSATSDSADGAPRLTTVEKIHRHEDYAVGENGDNDLALLQVDSTMPGVPIEVISDADEASMEENALGMVAGWGHMEFVFLSPSTWGHPDDPRFRPSARINPGFRWLSPSTWINPARPRVIRKADVPLATTAACNAETIWNGALDESWVCAGYSWGGPGPCRRDSGAGLTVDGLLVGIYSGRPTGHRCGDPDSYGRYSRASFFRDWIAEPR